MSAASRSSRRASHLQGRLIGVHGGSLKRPHNGFWLCHIRHLHGEILKVEVDKPLPLLPLPMPRACCARCAWRV